MNTVEQLKQMEARNEEIKKGLREKEGPITGKYCVAVIAVNGFEMVFCCTVIGIMKGAIISSATTNSNGFLEIETGSHKSPRRN